MLISALNLVLGHVLSEAAQSRAFQYEAFIGFTFWPSLLSLAIVISYLPLSSPLLSYNITASA
jgi:hypothetical protein